MLTAGTGMIAAGAVAPAACSRTLDAGPGLLDAGGGGGGFDGGAGTPTFVPCAPHTQVGTFYLAIEATSATAGYTGFVGSISDGVYAEPYQTVIISGACTLLADAPSPTCMPACSSQSCLPPGQCAPPPLTHSVGNIKITGLANAFVLAPFDGGSIIYNSEPGSEPFPPRPARPSPCARAAETSRRSRWRGSASRPLLPPADPLPVARDQALALTWESQGSPAQMRVAADIDLGNNAGIDIRPSGRRRHRAL